MVPDKGIIAQGAAKKKGGEKRRRKESQKGENFAPSDPMSDGGLRLFVWMMRSLLGGGLRCAPVRACVASQGLRRVDSIGASIRGKLLTVARLFNVSGDWA